ncbi:hypothetical protein [Robertmurraya korlensis]|uniref:hypothetical protein n=1 Tax=Robertmurraya korlensis TaxID=519977 RepID=UPI0008258E80|nr:hypothetical protein [Robertmurraya korlensis]
MTHCNPRGGSISDLLESLAPQTAVSGLQVDGNYERASAFITLDRRRGVAYFSETGGGLVVADIRKISLIEFPGV